MVVKENSPTSVYKKGFRGYITNMERTSRVFVYFTVWVLLSLTFSCLNILNIDWTRTNLIQGIALMVVRALLHGSVMEFPVQTIVTLAIGKDTREKRKVADDTLTLVLNYNLLAVAKEDIDECLKTMYEAFMGNLSDRISAVLVSATESEDLKKYELEVRDYYRVLIYDTLYQEGLNYVQGEKIDPLHVKHVWSRFKKKDEKGFLKQYLDVICDRFSQEFMVIHRVSRVLRKCGQYQDLMLLSEGDNEAYTYTDPEYYGKQARPYGQPLFYDSEDVENIYRRKFDYTLVLDGDTGVIKGSVFDILEIAAAHPERGIVQPSIKLSYNSDDTMFMHLEGMRQSIYEPMTNAIMAFLGQSSYFGKALIKNSIYIENVIGTRNNLIERVPIDVLSHDTFEAAILQPLYASSVQLLETPSYNYVSWNIRERRWNRGELLLSMYFWKNMIGKPMRWLQKTIQGDKFNATKLRTESKLDFVSSYIAHSALRQMFMKPMILIYILIHYNAHLRYKYASVITITFLVFIFPKFATCTKRNFKHVVLETLASILQFTPESVVGCVRIVRALQALLSDNVKWVPQRSVDETFKNSNPFVSSFKHLWGYSLIAVISAILIYIYARCELLILILLIPIFLLPIYTGFTTLSPNFRSTKTISEKVTVKIETPVPVSSPPKHEQKRQRNEFTTVPLRVTPQTLNELRHGNTFIIRQAIQFWDGIKELFIRSFL